jgi:hypothetical protein
MAKFFCRADFAKADPATSLEAARLERLLAGMEADVAAAFRDFVRDATSEEVMAAVGDKLATGDINGALDLIGSHIRAAGSVIPSIFIDAGAAEAKALAAQVAGAVGVSFDVGEPAAAALMRTSQLDFIRALDDSQRAATREALAVGLDRGQGFAGTARSVRASIGLSPDQVRATANYRRLLEIGSRQALDRQMRDLRFDPTVERAISTGTPLRPEQIDRMVSRYAATALKTRATTIARTESVRILSLAQEESFRQIMLATGLQAQDVEQSWHTVMDGRERFTHGVMNGQIRGYGELFDSPSGAKLRYPGDPSAPLAEIVSCRCRRMFRVRGFSARSVGQAAA